MIVDPRYGFVKGDDWNGAVFSKDEKYRYKLWRMWDGAKPFLNFCMLNPSTADEKENDPTVERCQRRAEMMGYGGLIVTNIFAYRSTDPSNLKKVDDPVGYWNDIAIISAAQNSDATICGWGKHGSLMRRGEFVLDDLAHWVGKKRVLALKVNKDGSPAHPLYIGYDVKPIPIDLKSR